MKRTPVNPWQWSLNFGYNQAEIIEGPDRHLMCAGQAAIDAEGRPQHAEDMSSQMSTALDNLESVLAAAQMVLANVVRLVIYTTDVDEAMKHFEVLGTRLGESEVRPPMTLLGVTRLAFPELMIEIEATACA